MREEGRDRKREMRREREEKKKERETESGGRRGKIKESEILLREGRRKNEGTQVSGVGTLTEALDLRKLPICCRQRSSCQRHVEHGSD